MRKDAKARRKKSGIFTGDMAICREYLNQPTKPELKRNCSKVKCGLLSKGKSYLLQQQGFEINNALPFKLASEKMNYI